MRSTPNFNTCNPAFFPLSIPAPSVLSRTVEYVARHDGGDAAQTLLDLLYALAHEQPFKVNDLAMLDAPGVLLAQALVHHRFQTGRLSPIELADAAERIIAHRQARRLAWRP